MEKEKDINLYYNKTTKEFLQENFLRYGTAVAQSRALVDVRDGLKPSLRQVLYANYTDGYTSNKRTAKFQKLMGSAARFYWHGKNIACVMLFQ